MCFVVLSGFVIFGKEFITLWVGPVYEPAYAMAIVVMVPFTIDIVQNLGLTILQVMNRYGFRAKMYFIAACLNIISTLFLAHFGRLWSSIIYGNIDVSYKWNYFEFLLCKNNWIRH